MSRFGAKLKELRESAGLTQGELAKKAGLSLKAVAHWEQGLREPAWSNVQTLAAALGVKCAAFEQAAQTRKPTGRARPKRK